MGGATGDVDMPTMHWVERAGIDCDQPVLRLRCALLWHWPSLAFSCAVLILRLPHGTVCRIVPTPPVGVYRQRLLETSGVLRSISHSSHDRNVEDRVGALAPASDNGRMRS